MSYYIIISIFDFLKEILYFPIWWYTKGALGVIKFLFNFLRNVEKYLALWIWIKNIFKPMYSQYDFAGMVISFFIRSFQIILRSAVVLFLVFLSFGFFLLWLVLPIVVSTGIFYQLQ